MANLHPNLARETTETTGTGALDLDGAVSGARTAVAALSAAPPDGYGGSGPWLLVSYKIQADDGSIWEIGLGTVTDDSPDTLTRTTIILNSLGTTAAVNLPDGTKTVIFCVPTQQDLGGGGTNIFTIELLS